MHVSDDEWSFIEPHIPSSANDLKHGGRPRHNARRVFEGISWILKTGARWRDMPKQENGPSYQTCHRMFQYWRRAGVFTEILEALSWELSDKGRLYLKECFIDATFAPAKKGAKK